MYSDIHEIIFVHQRKAAGSSVKALFHNAMPNFNDGVLDPDWNQTNNRVQNYYKFSVIRNPWDRFISGWKYLKSTRNRTIEDVLLNLPKENLIKNILHDQSLGARLAYTKELTARTLSRFKARSINCLTPDNVKIPHNQGHDYRHITRQQFESLYYANGQLAVDKVIFLEDLDSGLDEIFRECKSRNLIKPKVKLNQKRHEDDYRTYFNDKTLEIFNSIYAQDISIWGYRFEDGPGVLPSLSRNYERI